MEYKILEANGVENENIDGGAFNNFCAGGESGIVAEVLDECSITSAGSIVTVNTGLLNIKGIRVKITVPKDFTLQGTPAVDTIYRIVAKIVLSSGGNISFDLYSTTLQTLVQDNLYKNNTGTYEIELATFTHSTGGSVKNLRRTARLLHGNEREDLNEKFNVLEQSLKDDIDAFKVETNKEIKVFKEESQSQINTNTNKISALENALISAGTIDKSSSIMTEEKRQTGGTDLEGLTILDESLCTVNTIRGNTVTSKNLIPQFVNGVAYPDAVTSNGYKIDFSKNPTVDGLTYTVDNTGVITCNGTLLYTTYIILCKITDLSRFEVGKTYYVSGTPTGGSASTYRIYIHIAYKDGTSAYPSNTSFTVASAIDYIDVYLHAIKDLTYNNVQFKPMITLGSEPLSYSPYFEDIKHAQISGIKSSGRNLLTLDYMVTTDDGSTWTNALVKNPDGTFTISKNGTNRMSKQWACDIPAGTYTLFWEISDYKNSTGNETFGSPVLRFLDENKTEITAGRLYLTSWEKSQHTISKDVKYIDIVMQNNATDGDYVTIKKIMLYKGLEKPLQPYMPYGVESTLQFPKTIELGKWDYIINGNIIRKTTTLQLNGTEDMWSMNGGQYVEIYPDMSQFAPPSSGNFYADIVVNNGYTVTDNVGNATGKAVNLDTWGILSIHDPDYMSVNDADPEESVRRFKQHLQDLAMNKKPFTIYIESVTSTVEPIAFNSQYVVWNKGFEQVLTPEDENGFTCFDYGANTTEENEYMILLGGTN